MCSGRPRCIRDARLAHRYDARRAQMQGTTNRTLFALETLAVGQIPKVVLDPTARVVLVNVSQCIFSIGFLNVNRYTHFRGPGGSHGGRRLERELIGNHANLALAVPH